MPCNFSNLIGSSAAWLRAAVSAKSRNTRHHRVSRLSMAGKSLRGRIATVKAKAVEAMV